jgi:hypothetical protein
MLTPSDRRIRRERTSRRLQMAAPVADPAKQRIRRNQRLALASSAASASAGDVQAFAAS